MSKIIFSGRLTIFPGRLDRFKELIREFKAITEEKDRGTLVYEHCLDNNQTHCMFHEHYESPEAFLAHAENIHHLIPPLMETCDFGVTDISGELSQAVIDHLGGDLDNSPAFRYHPSSISLEKN